MKHMNIRTVCTESHTCYVLLVEDDEDIISCVKDRFPSYTGVQIVTAPSIKQAISIIKSISIEAILLDLGLRDSDGIDSLKSILDCVDNRIPVIVLTGNISLEDDCFELGAHDFIPKPIMNYDLVGRVKHSILRQRDKNKLIDHCIALQKEIDALKNIEERELNTEGIQNLRDARLKLTDQLKHVASIFK